MALERLLAKAWVNPINKSLDRHSLYNPVNQNYATTFELQSSTPMEAENSIAL